MASHLRETLKLLWKYMETDFYKKIKTELVKRQKHNLKEIESMINEFKEKKGFLYTILEDVRNKIFHYVPKYAEKWVKDIKREEKSEKPRFHRINYEPLEMNLAAEFQEHIFSSKLISNEGGKVFSAFAKMVDTQIKIVSISKEIINIIMERSNIEIKRPHDWFLEYRYGYMKNKEKSKLDCFNTLLFNNFYIIDYNYYLHKVSI